MKTGNPRLVLPLLPAGITVLLAACGGDEGSSSANSGATGMDRAFVDGMIPHHESAVEMAEIAQQRGQQPEVKDLAEAIVDTQNAEIGIDEDDVR